MANINAKVQIRDRFALTVDRSLMADGFKVNRLNSEWTRTIGGINHKILLEIEQGRPGSTDALARVYIRFAIECEATGLLVRSWCQGSGVIHEPYENVINGTTNSLLDSSYEEAFSIRDLKDVEPAVEAMGRSVELKVLPFLNSVTSVGDLASFANCDGSQLVQTDRLVLHAIAAECIAGSFDSARSTFLKRFQRPGPRKRFATCLHYIADGQNSQAESDQA